jgi:hypothetical protein
MAVNHLMMPAYNVGPAADWSPIHNALDSNRQLAVTNQQNALRQKQFGLAERADQRAGEMHGVQMAQARTQQEMQEARMVAGRVQYIQGLPPEQRMAAWAAERQQPGFRDLPAEFDNFDHAAPQLLGKAREYLGEKDQAQLGLIGAQTTLAQAQAQKAQREAAEEGDNYGREIKPYQTGDGKIWGIQAGSRGNTIFHNLSEPGSPPIVVPRGGRAPSGGAPGPQSGGAPSPLSGQSLVPFSPNKVVGDQVFNPGRGTFADGASGALRGGAYATEEGKAVMADIKSRDEAIQASRSKMPRLEIMSKLIDSPEIYQGTGGNAVLELRKAAQTFGIDVSGVPGAEAIRAIGNQFALQLRNPAGGEGMPGALSDSDRNFLVQSTPNLGNTRDGNRLLVRTMIDLERHKINENAEASRYLREHKSSAGLTEHMEKWAQRNPALSRETRSAITRATGVQYGVQSGPPAGPQSAKQFNSRLPATEPGGAGAFASPGLAGNMPKIADDTEYEALPSGSTFIAPDGSWRRKP